MRKRLFLTTFTIFLISGFNISWSQISKIIDEIKFEDYNIVVVFYDPYLNLIEQNPSFNDMDSTKQLEVYDKYLLNNVIYDFQLTKKKKILKHYIIKGNPLKTIDKQNLPRNTIYQLDIVKHSDEINYYQHMKYQNEKILTVDKLTYFETLFENMQLIQDELKLGHRYIAYNFFGRYRMPIYYRSIQHSTLSMIADDLMDVIPIDLIQKDYTKYNNPFFDYQSCILNYFRVDLIEKIFVELYDKDGNLSGEDPRIEIIENITNNINDSSQMSGVTSLPFFTVNDSAVLINHVNGELKYRISTYNNAPVDKYLDDIIVTKNTEGIIERIDATLLIHAYSINGNLVRKERYVAYFKEFNNCILPYKIINADYIDIEFLKPRIIVELDYLFYRK